MARQGGKKARKQEALIAALLTEPTHEAAAAKVGLALSTVQVYLTQADFLQAYRTARRQLVEHAIAALQCAAGEAFDTLRRLLESPSWAARLGAAKSILDYALKGIDIMDLTEKLECLMAEVEELKQARQTDAAADAAAADWSGATVEELRQIRDLQDRIAARAAGTLSADSTPPPDDDPPPPLDRNGHCGPPPLVL